MNFISDIAANTAIWCQWTGTYRVLFYLIWAVRGLSCLQDSPIHTRICTRAFYPPAQNKAFGMCVLYSSKMCSANVNMYLIFSNPGAYKNKKASYKKRKLRHAGWRNRGVEPPTFRLADGPVLNRSKWREKKGNKLKPSITTSIETQGHWSVLSRLSASINRRNAKGPDEHNQSRQSQSRERRKRAK